MPTVSPPSSSEAARIQFRSRGAFYAGVAAVVGGVLLHVPMILMAGSTHIRLAGQALDLPMVMGMCLIALGLLLAAYGLAPPAVPIGKSRGGGQVVIAVLDDAPLTARHWKLIAAVAVALVVDVMKPASLAFVLPGMRAEYGLSAQVAALLPFAALTGTVIGSILWGRVGDLIGRRATILYAALVFVGTAICGAMPAFGWNLVMCFIMGAAAGGMLPIAMTLLSEILPVRHRGLIMVLVGGAGALGGFLVASVAAMLLEPVFGWRSMWFLNFPTGLLLLAVNRYIIESPRFLLSRGRVDEANKILRSFGAVRLLTGNERGAEVPGTGIRRLFQRSRLPQTLAVTAYGFSWGLVNYGFLLWLPLNLRSMGFGAESSDAILARSAFLSLPAVLLVALLYSAWSSKRTLLLAASISGMALLAFWPLVTTVSLDAHPAFLGVLLVILLMSSSGMTSTVGPYSTEIYSTDVRSTGSGLAAGAGKIGGLVGQGVLLAHEVPPLAVAALLVSGPVMLAVLLMAVIGVETRLRALD